MAQLILDITGRHYGVRDLLAQELAITLTHSVRRLSHGALSHREFARGVRR